MKFITTFPTLTSNKSSNYAFGQNEINYCKTNINLFVSMNLLLGFLSYGDIDLSLVCGSSDAGCWFSNMCISWAMHPNA